MYWYVFNCNENNFFCLNLKSSYKVFPALG